MSVVKGGFLSKVLDTSRKIPKLRDVILLAAIFIILIPVLKIFRVTQFMIFCIFVMSLDLLYGYMGYLSFGQVLFLGTGVYASTMFSVFIHPNPVLAMLAGIIAGAIIATILGSFLVELKGAAFALTNMAFNYIGYFLIRSTFAKYTYGDDGLSSKVKPWGIMNFSNETFAFIFVLISFLGIYLLLRTLTDSSYGVIIKSIKEKETRVRFLGYNTYKYKLYTYIIAGTIAAFAGTLNTLYMQFVSPTFIHPMTNIEPIFSVLIGGAGNLYGAIAGGMIYMLLRDWLSTIVVQWEWILGVILLLVVFWFRTGLVGFIKKLVLTIRLKTNKKG
jgi:branched-chain amino acid transport system permease protein